jgi:hypothetical protein
MSRAKLFTPLRLGAFELANRIVIAPMCQYSAEEGCMTDWHVIHLGHLALSGAALLTIEATAVVPEGRITYGDVGLYSDDCEAAIGRVLHAVRRWSDMPTGHDTPTGPAPRYTARHAPPDRPETDRQQSRPRGGASLSRRDRRVLRSFVMYTNGLAK